MESSWIGVDVAKASFEVFFPATGEGGQFENTPKGFKAFARKMKKHPGFSVCMEATGVYSQPLADFLYENGVPVSVENPARIKAFGKARGLRTKNDPVDARLISAYAEAMSPRGYQPLPPELAELRDLLNRRDQLVEMIQQETNRLEGASAKTARHIKRHIRWLERERDGLLEALEELSNQDEQLRHSTELLCSIPSIGKLTAWRILTELAGREFLSARQFAAYAGLTPREFQSGSSINRPARMCKVGNNRLRASLYMPAMTARKWNPLIREWANRLEEKGKPKKAIIGACMRKLLHIAYGVLKTQKPFNENHAVLA